MQLFIHFCTITLYTPENWFSTLSILSQHENKVPLIPPKQTRYHLKCQTDIHYLAPHDLVGKLERIKKDQK